jgi:hypothetical protein
MFESMPRAGTCIVMLALAAATAAGCAASEGPAGGRAAGGSADDLTAAIPPPDPPPFQCGGFANVGCPGDGAAAPPYACVDDFRDECDPENGGADCSGLCVGPKPRLCGGPTDPPCAGNEVCVADPHVACLAGDDFAACSTGVCALVACDPDQPCGDAPTCVGGLLYPTTCGPHNCDAPIGPCDPWGECGPPPPCPAPPPECHWEGGGCSGGQWTCGTLVCDELPPSP